MTTRGKTFTILGSALILFGATTLAYAESYEQKDLGSSNAYKAIYTGAGTSSTPYDATVNRRAFVSPAPAATPKSDDSGVPPGYLPGREREY